MNDIYSRDSSPYRGNDDKEGDRPAVQLSELRKAAIRRVCRASGLTGDAVDEFTNNAFGIWANARHAACEEFLSKGTVDSLSSLRAQGDVIFGAVTNGNADVFAVPSLKPFFDFSILSEDVGVAKPNLSMFEEAIKTAAELGGSKDNWVHVGDDVECDILPAKKMGFETIWTTEFLKDDKITNSKEKLRTTETRIVASIKEIK